MDTHGHTAAPEVSPQELARAVHGWGNFSKFAFYAVLHLIAPLVLMAVFLL